MNTLIKYNNRNIFDELDIPTPMFSRSSSEIIYGEKRGIKDTLSLNGQIYIKTPPVDCDYFTLLTQKRDLLMNFFSEDYGSFLIIEDGTTILEKEFCEIINIDFPSSNNVKIIEYSVTIECIDENLHNDFFGIEEPGNSTSFNLTENGQYSITRNISATGIKTSSNQAIKNAIDFVRNNSGKESVNLSIIEDGLQLYLISKSENINRFKNSFSVTEQYIADKNNKNLNQGVLTYNIDSNKNSAQVHEVTVSGDLKFGIDEDFNKARNRIKEIDFYSIATKSEIQNLIEKPLSVNINENEKSGKIEFSFVYNNDTSFDECGVSREYNFGISEVGNKITVSVSGLISARGPIGKRWNIIKDKFYSEEITNIFNKAQENVNLYFSGIILNQNYESKSIVESEKLGSIKFDLSFSNKNKIDNFKSFNYNLDMELSVPNISVDMNFGGAQNHYSISRGGFTKPILSISANGEYTNITKSQAETKIKEKINSVITDIESSFNSDLSGLSAIVKSENSNFSKNKKLISYSKVVEYFKSPQIIGKAT
tara:strand:+ start:1216 stop:2832 length:1617 start_codon:yes stop_codon:yes gene_type:complete